MAANLTPQYIEAERKLRTAKTPQEKIEILQEMLALMPKHKATEKLQAQHKSKIAKLKEEMRDGSRRASTAAQLHHRPNRAPDRSSSSARRTRGNRCSSRP